MNKAGFEERFENSLLKSVGKGKTTITGRASFHRKKTACRTMQEI
jgi:hypothetical protein